MIIIKKTIELNIKKCKIKILNIYILNKNLIYEISHKSIISLHPTKNWKRRVLDLFYKIDFFTIT